jgi:hypothetical protein
MTLKTDTRVAVTNISWSGGIKVIIVVPLDFKVDF